MAAPPLRRWPAEWEPHRATWLAWPHNVETWPGQLDAVEDSFCEIVRAIVPGEKVEILVKDAATADRVRGRLVGAGVEAIDSVGFHFVRTNDAWIRDHGGAFIFEGGGEVGREGEDAAAPPERRLLDFAFDAWGRKYPPWDLDAKVAAEMARIAGVPRISSELVLEFGSVEGDGEGTILTTESCLLNPNRARPGQDRSREALEGVLGEMFGAKKVLWLGDGIEGDDTDGHIDDLTRFVAPGRVVTIVESDPGDSNYRVLKENWERLDGLEDAAGRKLEVVELPMPGMIEGLEGRLPASYANFYFANQAVLVPVFGVDADREAISILERVIRDREVVPIPGRSLVVGLGAIHCLTQQEPGLEVGVAK
jgi:agmatine deiminase